jgi:5-methylcytosine-specific restriction endonuclease McrA
MAYDKITLRKIYDRTSSYCHICKKKLSFTNYGKIDKKGAWEVEHSRPRSKGGSDHLNNLYASCISCNRTKGMFTSRTARSWHDRKKAPLSKVKRKEEKYFNAIFVGIAGLIIGLYISPFGAFVGAALGGKIGYDVDPDR